MISFKQFMKAMSDAKKDTSKYRIDAFRMKEDPYYHHFVNHYRKSQKEKDDKEFKSKTDFTHIGIYEDLIGKKTPSIESIAKKHKVPISVIRKQVKIGSKIEREHTNNKKEANEIARDHELEFPEYYSALKKMEKKLHV